MAVTYIRRSREELNRTLQRAKEADLLRKAELLSASPNPDNIFLNHSIQSEHPFGVLVLFGNPFMREQFGADLQRVDDLDWLEQVIDSFHAYPPAGSQYFEEKRQAFLREVRRYHHLSKHTPGTSSQRERSRLEKQVQDAEQQKEWLEKENTDRLRRIASIEQEIRAYEEALADNANAEEHMEKIRKAREESEPIRTDIALDTAKLRDLTERIEALRKERAMTDSKLSPATSRLQEIEEERLTGEHKSLSDKILDNTSRLKQLEDTIESLEGKVKSSAELEDTLRESLGVSRRNLEATKSELDGGTQMVSTLDLRVEILAARLEAIKQETEMKPEDIANAYIAVVARAEELLNAWISCSVEFHRILKVDGISGKELVEAIFFASGPVCAEGSGACAYLDGTGVSLDTLLLYGTDEERVGFRHVIAFE